MFGKILGLPRTFQGCLPKADAQCLAAYTYDHYALDGRPCGTQGVYSPLS